jgi:uncharacterized protein (TIGR00106 family)
MLPRCVWSYFCYPVGKRFVFTSIRKRRGAMLLEFSIFPVGTGSSIGDQLAEVLKIVDESGLPYKVNPMGTVVEGEWDDLMNLVKNCHKTILKNSDRVVTRISVDDRKDKPNRLEEKVKSVEQRIGKTLKK